jgi:excisionase family DNA binding protein
MMLAGAVSAKRPSLDRDRHQPISPGLPFHFDIRDGQKVRRVKGFADLKATEQHATEMERKAARVRAGYIDPAEAQALRPLAEHLRDYADVLRAKGDMEKHVRDTVARCSALFAGCEFALPLDAEAGKAAEWLVNQRRDGPPVELPSGVDTFRPSEAAALLGVTKSALNRSLQRHGLTATGKGKARRIPRTSVETLAAVAVRGVGPATVNHTVRAVRGFFRWLVKAKRIGSNPLESLTLLNAAVDVRRTRRELTADELHRLFTAARESGRTFRGLTGTDRFTLYLTAAGTGFRANALAKLTPADFDLEAAGSVVTLAARFNK